MSETGGIVKGAILFRLESTPVLRLWAGAGDFAAPANAIDVGEETYLGVGTLSGIPEVEQLINGAFSRVEFALSGLNAAIAALVDADADTVKGARVNLGLLMLDDDWQPDGEPLWVWDGEADVLMVTKAGVADGEVHTARLSVASATSDRKRPEFSNWTHAQHIRAHPGDLFFNQVTPGEKTKHWPN